MTVRRWSQASNRSGSRNPGRSRQARMSASWTASRASSGSRRMRRAAPSSRVTDASNELGEGVMIASPRSLDASSLVHGRLGFGTPSVVVLDRVWRPGRRIRFLAGIIPGARDDPGAVEPGSSAGSCGDAHGAPALPGEHRADVPSSIRAARSDRSCVGWTVSRSGRTELERSSTGIEMIDVRRATNRTRRRQLTGRRPDVASTAASVRSSDARSAGSCPRRRSLGCSSHRSKAIRLPSGDQVEVASRSTSRSRSCRGVESPSHRRS